MTTSEELPIILGAADDLGDYTLFTIFESAGALKLHPDTVREHVAEGTIGHVRLGKRIMIRRDQLVAYIETNTHPAQ